MLERIQKTKVLEWAQNLLGDLVLSTDALSPVRFLFALDSATVLSKMPPSTFCAYSSTYVFDTANFQPPYPRLLVPLKYLNCFTKCIKKWYIKILVEGCRCVVKNNENPFLFISFTLFCYQNYHDVCLL